MLFQTLGRIVQHFWLLFLGIWVAVLVVTWALAPPWDKVAQDREFAFLPSNTPSRQAEHVYAKAFPTDRMASNIVLVLHQTNQEAGSLQRNLHFIEDVLEPGLRKIAVEEGGLAYEIKPSEEPLFSDEKENEPPAKPEQRSIIARIETPNVPGMGGLLVSEDEQVLLVVVELTTDFLSSANSPTIDRVTKLVRELGQEGKIPAGLQIHLTGSAIIGRDHSVAELQSVRATGVLTVLLVAGLLILIYQAPLLAIIPLLTVYLAVEISIHFLSILAQHGHVTLFQGLQIYITILAYGAGVDYSLFLTARYKEELERGSNPKEAVANALGGVGAALAASAATVMCGIAMMLFAEFGKFREAGFAIPLCLLLVLLATLTFSPSLLCMAGHWAFWPARKRFHASHAHPHPSSPGWFGRGGALERIWERVGELLLRRAGTVWLVTVVIMAPFAIAAGLLYHHLSYDVIGNLPASASSARGTQLLEEHFPAGLVGPITVLLVDKEVDFRGDQGRDIIARLTDRLREEKQQLGLADIRSMTEPLGITKAAQRDFSGLDLPADVRQEGIQRAAVERYTTDLGGRAKIATRLDLLLSQSPFSRDSIDNLDRIERAVRAALPDDVRQNAQLYFVGSTASVRDLAVVIQRDRRVIEILVLISVFVILVLLLRRVLVPVYLLLTVLFSYYTTLGVAFAVFWLINPHGFTGIDWKVAIFLFTILIAVGEDYNIFLMTRVHEEQRVHGPVRGITVALDRTGPIISSCGIIMAGTFATLLAGSLTEMKQLGFSLAFGVLLDTFIVRPILVPAFLILLHTGRLPVKGQAEKVTHVQDERSRSQHETSSS